MLCILFMAFSLPFFVGIIICFLLAISGSSKLVFPRSRVALLMDVQGLAFSWEADEAVRNRLRKDRKLCLHPSNQRWCEPNRPNCVRNTIILLPALEQLAGTDGWKLPHIEPLQTEIGNLFEKCGVEVPDKVVYTGSVELKKMMSFVKRRASRKEVTKETGLLFVQHC